MKFIKKNKNKLAIILLIIVIILSNIGWSMLYKQQKDRVKNSLLPPITNDYYTNQLLLTKYFKMYHDSFYAENPEQYAIIKDDYNKKEIKNVPLINQNPKYPNGCESASAVMLLNYYGSNITLDEFISKLPKNQVYVENGTRFGPDPGLYYAGNPADDTKGWGCFDLVIAKTIQQIIKEEKLQLKVNTQNGKDPLDILALNYPCLIWVTINYEEVEEVFTWLSYDQKETYTYPKNEHVVVLTGYDDNYYYINDPLKNETNIPVEKEKLEASYDSLGRQFVYITKEFVYDD